MAFRRFAMALRLAFKRQSPAFSHRPLFAANEEQIEKAAEEKTIGAANEIGAESNGWVKLSGYGDFMHAKGVQRMTREAANQMAGRFNSLLSKASRLFTGVPIYVGHPDAPEFANQAGHQDTKAYAWIEAMEARDDGLFVKPKWSEAGKQLLANAFYRFLSPYWAMVTVKKNIFSPVELISIGLTNKPNIPGPAIANELSENKNKSMNETLKAIMMRLGFTEPQTTAFANSGEGAPTQDAILGKLDGTIAAANEKLKIETRNGELDAKNKELKTANDELTARNKQIDGELKAANEERSKALIDAAVADGRIIPAKREFWANEFKENFTKAANIISSIQPGKEMKTKPAAKDLSQRGAKSLDKQKASSDLIAFANEISTKSGIPFTAAYHRACEEHPDLLERLKTPAAA